MSARKAAAGKGKKERHWFKMAPIFQNCRFKQIAVDFTPLKNPRASIVPTFVNNRLEMAPTFMLPAFPLKKEDEMWYSHLLHTRRIAEDEHSSMLIPRPKPDSVCQICKETYPDYITHIFDEKHKIALHASPFQKDIRKLVRRIRRERRERDKNDANAKEGESDRSDEMKRKPISKENIID